MARLLDTTISKRLLRPHSRLGTGGSRGLGMEVNPGVNLMEVNAHRPHSPLGDRLRLGYFKV